MKNFHLCIHIWWNYFLYLDLEKPASANATANGKNQRKNFLLLLSPGSFHLMFASSIVHSTMEDIEYSWRYYAIKWTITHIYASFAQPISQLSYCLITCSTRILHQTCILIIKIFEASIRKWAIYCKKRAQTKCHHSNTNWQRIQFDYEYCFTRIHLVRFIWIFAASHKNEFSS